jgi:hypothetical protein
MKIADNLQLRPSLLTAAKVSAYPPLCHPACPGVPWDPE